MSDKCPECESSVETLYHFLLGCPNSVLCNDVLNACERLHVSPQLECILKHFEILDIIIEILNKEIRPI